MIDVPHAVASVLSIGAVILVFEHFGIMKRSSHFVRALLVALVVFAVLLVLNLLWPAATSVAGQVS